MIEQAMADFAKRIGIAGLSFSDTGSGSGIVQLEIQNIGTVYFEKQLQDRAEELLVYMAQKFNTYDTQMPRKLLEFCSFDKGHIPPLYGSIAGDTCILGLRFQTERLSGADLENSVYYLHDKFNALMQG